MCATVDGQIGVEQNGGIQSVDNRFQCYRARCFLGKTSENRSEMWLSIWKVVHLSSEHGNISSRVISVWAMRELSEKSEIKEENWTARKAKVLVSTERWARTY